jgi:hypothetical protein
MLPLRVPGQKKRYLRMRRNRAAHGGKQKIDHRQPHEFVSSRAPGALSEAVAGLAWSNTVISSILFAVICWMLADFAFVVTSAPLAQRQACFDAYCVAAIALTSLAP